jgi:hypothetical protein
LPEEKRSTHTNMIPGNKEKYENHNLSLGNSTGLGDGEYLNPCLHHGQADGDDGQDDPGSQEGWLGLQA